MSYVMIMPSQPEPTGRPQYEAPAPRPVEPTPLGRAARWVADKSLNSVLDALLGRVLGGPLVVRIAGAALTGLVASSVVWLVADRLLPGRIGTAAVGTAAVGIALGALAGAALGWAGGLLAGGGAAWLIGVLAESTGTEAVKDPVSPYLPPLLVWCASTLVGGLCGWVAGILVARLEARYPALGRVVQLLAYVGVFAAAAVVLVRTRASAALWSTLGTLLPATPLLTAFILGIAAGAVVVVVSGLFLVWCYAPADVRRDLPFLWGTPRPGRFARVVLPAAQGVLTAMVWTLLVAGPSPQVGAAHAAVVTVTVWTVPWAAAVAIAAFRGR